MKLFRGNGANPMISAVFPVKAEKGLGDRRPFSALKAATLMGVGLTALALWAQSKPVFALDLPAASAGCASGTTTCNLTSSLGNVFIVTSNLAATTFSNIIANASVTNSILTINSGITLNANNGNASISSAGSGNVITNYGIITAGRGINLQSGDNQSVINYGSIISTSSSLDAIMGGGSGLAVTNNAGGILSGAVGIRFIGATGGNTINNAGTITGTGGTAIIFTGANNTVNLQTSSVITGAIQTTTASGNVLNLQGGSSATGTVSSAFTGSGFQNLNINAPGSIWNFQGPIAISSATNVSAGTLNVTGAGSNFRALTIAAGAATTFAQTGTNTFTTLNVASGASLSSTSGANLTMTGAGTLNGAMTLGGAMNAGGNAFTMGSGSSLTVTDTGSYVTTAFNGIVVNGSSSITNNGTITGTGTTGAIKIANNAVVTIANSGTISGTGANGSAIWTETGSVNLYNTGTLIGATNNSALSLNSDNSSITLDTGSVLMGGTGVGTQMPVGITNNLVMELQGKNLSLTLAGTNTENGDMLGRGNNNALGLTTLTSSADSVWTLGGKINMIGTRVDTLKVSGNLIVSGTITQSGSGGGTTIDTGATLSLGNGGTTGMVTKAIIDNGTLVFNRSDNLAYSLPISGSGILVQQGSGTTTITAINGYTGGTLVANGTLNAANSGAVGPGSVTIDAPGTLALGFSNATFANNVDNAGTLSVTGTNTLLAGTISGAGTNRISDANTRITGNNSGFTGLWDIAPTGSASTTTQQNLGPAATQINGTLHVLPVSGGFTYINALSSSGTLHAVMGSAVNAFDFAPSAGTAFTGTAAVGLGTFDLSGTNTAALTNATLRIDGGNVTTVGNGNQTISGLAFNGGTAIFDASILGAALAQTTITTTGKLDLSGTGTIKATIPTGFANNPPTIDTALPLLQQDDAPAITKLVIAQGTVIGSGGGLVLVDQIGNPISNAQTLSITQGSQTVAIGSYDFRMSSGSTGDGLYISYGLKELNLLTSGSNALVLTPAPGATGPATDMSAKITGAGDLAIEAGSGALVSLSNPLNDYTGATFARTGTLQLLAQNALGYTSSLNLSPLAIVDMNNRSQAVGALNTATGAQVIISDASTLTITGGQRTSGNSNGGGIEANTLFGTGAIALSASTLHVNGAQSGFAGGIEIGNTSRVIANDAAAFNDARQISFTGADGIFTFGSNAAFNGGWASVPNGTALASFSGAGTIQFRDGADVHIAGDNAAFNGLFAITPGSTMRVDGPEPLGSATLSANGTFKAIAALDWQLSNSVIGSGVVLKSGSASLLVDQSLAAFTGLADVAEGTLLVGDVTMTGSLIGGSAHIGPGAILSGSGTVMGSVSNAGMIASLNALSGHENDSITNLTVGPLSNSGSIQLAGTAIGNTLTVTGGLTSNGGKLIINTVLAGDDAATDRLILNGGTTSGTTSVVVMNMGGTGATTGVGIRIVETSNGATTSAGSFMLNPASSGYRAGSGTLAIGAYEYALIRGGGGGVADDWYLSSATSIPSSTTPVSGPVYRPEGGVYLDNRQVAQSMFLLTRHDREGFGSAQGESLGAWARVTGYKTKASAGDNTLSVEATTVATQLGIDLVDKTNAMGRFRAGIMTGIGSADTSSRSHLVGSLTADGRVDGTSVGAYATWQQDPKGERGFYLDGWAQYGWFTNSVKGNGLASTKYHSNTFTASLEAGYSFDIFRSQSWRLAFEPQLQAIYQNYSAGSITETSGTQIRFSGSDNVMTRFGGRLSAVYDAGSGLTLRPYLEANWWHNFKNSAVLMNENVVRWNRTANTVEAKLGIAAEAGKWSFWAQTTVETGGRYRSYGGQAGLKFVW